MTHPTSPSPPVEAAPRQTTARMREDATTEDYRNAISGEGEFGSLGYDWADKPHRLVYDLCGEVDDLTRQKAGLEAMLVDAQEDLKASEITDADSAVLIAELRARVKLLEAGVRPFAEMSRRMCCDVRADTDAVEIVMSVREMRCAAELVPEQTT